jgi:hypothetical protein
MRAYLALLAVGALLAATPAPALAEECAPIEGGSSVLEHIDANQRLAFIRERLAADARRARIWSWTWGAAYGAIAGTYYVLSGVESGGDRVNDLVNAAAASVGLAVLVILPLNVMHDQTWLEKRLARAPNDHVCAKLADAERLLIRDAESEAFGKSPLVHVGNIAFNLGLGLLLGVGYGHWNEAAQAWFVGAAVGELQIVTQPVDAVYDLRRYRFGLIGHSAADRPRIAVVPLVSPRNLGLGLALQF